MKEVELLPAYEWDCPECGTLNFSRAIPVLISTLKQQGNLFFEDMEISEGEIASMQPETVCCKQCKAVFTSFMLMEPIFEK